MIENYQLHINGAKVALNVFSSDDYSQYLQVFNSNESDIDSDEH